MQRLNMLLMVAGALALPALAAPAETYPSHPIRMIIPAGAGGITDVLGRVIAQKMGEGLGQQVVIDNRPGASGTIGTLLVAKAPADGYTLMMAFPSHMMNPGLYANLPYDTLTAFTPVSLVSTVTLILLVTADLPAKSVSELIALAKARPGQLNFGSTGQGSLGSLGTYLFSSTAGIQITPVPYKGVPQVLTALVSGEIQAYFSGSVSSAAPQIKAGRLRALGVSGRQRLPSLPDVPPIADALPGYEARGWNGILAPAGTPQPIINRLHREIVVAVKSPAFNEQLLLEGSTAVGSTPQEFGAVIQADVRK